jgi:hypothetical protein
VRFSNCFDNIYSNKGAKKLTAFFSGIAGFFKAIADFIGMIVEKIVSFVEFIGEGVVYIGSWFGGAPPILVTMVVCIFGVFVVVLLLSLGKD